MGWNLFKWLKDPTVYFNPRTEQTPIPMVLSPQDPNITWYSINRVELLGRQVVRLDLGSRVQIPPGMVGFLVGNPQIERRLNIMIHATMVKPRDHESTVRVLVSTLNTGVTTIEAAEEVAEMVLVPTLMPFLEELGKIYWTLPITKRFKEFFDDKDEDGPGSSSKQRPCYERASGLPGLIKSRPEVD